MSMMTLSLSDQMKSWVEDCVRSGAYADAEDYLRALIRRDRETREALVSALIEGEASGVSSRTVGQIAAETRAKIENGAL